MKGARVRFIPQFVSVSCFCLLLLYSSCAVQVRPTGGPPDKKPPFPKAYNPDSAAVNLKAKKISILFDEFIQLKDLNNQLVISPPMERAPDVKAKGKTLEIIFREPLKDSTTYSINFGNAIADIRESNVLADFKYVFSTGSYLDSLSVSGTVVNAFTRLPEKGVMVMLYHGSDDSLPFKSVPSYFARTGAGGEYSIGHIKPGTYKVFALRDQNGNYKYDVGELMGFQEQNLILYQSQKAVNLSLFKEAGGRQKLKRAFQASYGKIILSLAAPGPELYLRPLSGLYEPIGEPVLERNASGDSLTYWFVPPATDSIKLELRDKNKVYDTLKYKLITKEKMLSQHKGEKFMLSLMSTVAKGRNLDLDATLFFSFSHPVTSGVKDPSRMQLREDTLKSNVFSGSSFLPVDNAKRLFKWKECPFPWKENRKYHLLVLPGAFTDLYGFTHDTLNVEFKTPELKYYGTFKLNVQIQPGHYVLQLLDDKDNTVKTVSLEGNREFMFEYLTPMNYRIRLITDLNGNGKWDSGDYLHKKQPEPVIYYKEPVTVRSNWDQETVWIVK
ncbi:MAG: Ig-like domain-containing protein [Bacteroidia bacterium]